MLEEEVIGIQWNEDGCLITSKTGTVLRCQHAIITIPLGVFDIGVLGEEMMSTAGWVTLIFWTLDLPLTFLTG